MPTALELSRDEWQPYIQAARQRPPLPELSVADQQTREQLLERVRKAAALIKERLGAKQLILFGSLADAIWFTSNSDVDIAVEGLTTEAYWQAWQMFEEVIDTHPVDLIELETAKPSLRNAIQHYGIEL